MSATDKNRKGAESDDDFNSDIGDDDIDEELALPSVLVGISHAEKRELYRFKHTHNERDWEEEVLRRSDLFARKVDMERLKNMAKKGGAQTAAPVPAAKATAKGKRKAQSSEDEASEQSDDSGPATTKNNKRKAAPPPQPGAGQARRGKMISFTNSDSEEEAAKGVQDSEEEEDEEASEEEEEEESEADSDNDDDLFDSEEEEEISKRVQEEAGGGGRQSKGQGRATRKVLGGKKKAPVVSTRSSRRGARRNDDGSQESGEEDEDEEGDEEEELYGRRLNNNKKGGKQSQFGYDDDGEDVNLSRIKDKNKTGSGRGKGYDSDGSNGGAGRAGGGAKKILTVQEQMQAEVAALMLNDDSPEATVEDYWTIQPRRTEMIMKWLNEPFLKNALENFYVRFSVGDFNNKAVCRMCKVVGVDLHGRPYKLAENGENCTVRLTLMVAGAVRKQCRICQVSNSRITPEEFKYYFDCAAKATTEGKEADKLLTKNQVRAMRKLFLSHTVHHVYTDQEIKDMVKKSIGLDKSKVTEYSTAIESLQKRLTSARENKDYDALEVVQKTIETVQRAFAEEKEKFDKAASKALAVNRKMKESNVQRDMAAGNRLRAENLEAAAKGIQSKSEADPFSRRETRPKILWNTGKRLEEARLPEGSAPVVEVAAVEAEVAVTTLQGTTFNGGNDRDKPAWKIVEPPSLEQIRRRVKQRLGVDPIFEAARSQRDRYLSRVCARLPALHSEERTLLRHSLDAKSLEDALVVIQESEGAMEVA